MEFISIPYFSLTQTFLELTRGSETGKVRHCIIVTNNVYNARVPPPLYNRYHQPTTKVGAIHELPLLFHPIAQFCQTGAGLPPLRLHLDK